MVTYDEAAAMLEAVLDEVPDELFKGLSGGVILAEEFKLHPNSIPQRPLYIMGEYRNNSLGRNIVLYYGSFSRVFAYRTRQEFEDRLRHTFKHELRHHLEKMSGINTLNKYDDDKMAMYEMGMDINNFSEPPIG